MALSAILSDQSAQTNPCSSHNLHIALASREEVGNSGTRPANHWATINSERRASAFAALVRCG